MQASDFLPQSRDFGSPEYQCSVCGKSMYTAGKCYVCRREDLFEDEIRELSKLNPREVYGTESEDSD